MSAKQLTKERTMNARYEVAEVIGNVELMDEEGDETYCGDKVEGYEKEVSNVR